MQTGIFGPWRAERVEYSSKSIKIYDEMVDGEIVNADVDPETGELPGQKEWTA